MLYAGIGTLIFCLNILLTYTVVLNRKLRNEKWMVVSVIVAICLLQIVLSGVTDISYADSLNVIVGIGIPIILIKGTVTRKLLTYPLIFLGMYGVNELGRLFVNIVDKYLQTYILVGTMNTNIIENVFSNLLLKCNVIFVILVIYLIKYKRSKPRQTWIMQMRQYILVLVSFISFVIIIVFTRLLGTSLKIEESHNVALTFSYTIKGKALGLLLISLGLIFICLCIWQILTLRKEEAYLWKNEAYENYMRMQEDSIQRMVEKDESVRRFRHDMHAHILALEAIAKETNNKQLQEYLAEMQKESAAYHITNYSGIAAIDAVVSEIMMKAKGFQISLQWKGTLSGCKDVKVYDLCTIFANLMMNAVEACQNIQEEQKVIYVKTYCYEESIYINIGNPCMGKVFIGEDGLIETSKRDKKNHGFGTKNVLDTVKKNGGSIQYITQENWFEVKIVM